MSIEIEGVEYSLEIADKSNSWGAGIKVSIYKPDGQLLNTISYFNHPEFGKFEEYQSKTTEELKAIAISRIGHDMATENFKLATESGIGLLLPINYEQKT